MMQARLVGAFAAALSIGCVGNIGASTGPPSGGGASTGAGGAGAVGGPAGGDKLPTDGQMKTANPELFTIAAKYFPGDAAAGAPKRMFRLTRTQLDATAKALLPAQQAASALAAMPPDPLQTNYEYAANLSFNAANFTPYTKWVDDIVAGVARQSGERHQLRAERQFAGVPAVRSEALRGARVSRHGVGRRARASCRFLHRQRGRGRGGRRDGGSGRPGADVAELRVPRRGADRRHRVPVAGRAPAEHHLHAGGRASRDRRAVVGDAGRHPADVR